MLYIVFTLIIGAIGLGTLLVAFFHAETPDTSGFKETMGIVSFVCAAVFVVVTFLCAVHIVDARNVGVVKTFGSITGQVGEGFQFTMPWQSVEEWNIRLQVITADTECSNGTKHCMDAGSVDIQDVYVEGALNIEVNTTDVQNLARNIGKTYPDTIVRNRMYQVVKRVTAQYPADQILAKREEIRAKIVEGLKTELAPYSITVTDFLLTNIDFSDDFRKSIDAKQKATQDALTAENVVRIKEAEARQVTAVAEGAAQARRIAAQAEADANNLINASLTGNILQLRLAQTLGDKLQFVPSGAGVIIDPASLLKKP